MKKLISIILAVMLFVGAFSISSYATELPIIDISTVSVKSVSISDRYAGSGYNVIISASITGSVKTATAQLVNGSEKKDLELTYDSSSNLYVATFKVDKSTTLGTWTVSNVIVNGNSYKVSSKAFTVIKLGDVNRDGKINNDDALMAFKAIFGLVILSDEEKCAADTNKDGQIDFIDVFGIVFRSFGFIK